MSELKPYCASTSKLAVEDSASRCRRQALIDCPAAIASRSPRGYLFGHTGNPQTLHLGFQPLLIAYISIT